MADKDYVVQEGEGLPEIAEDLEIPYPLFYDADKPLKSRRPNPNVLWPGESLKVPPKPKKTESAKAKPPAQAGGEPEKFQTEVKKRVLRLKLLGSEGKPLNGVKCELTFAGQTEAIATVLKTDGMLVVDLPQEKKPKKQKGRDLRATLVVGVAPDVRVFELRLRRLTPVLNVPDGGLRGAKARLRNLGYAVTKGGDDPPEAPKPDPDAELDGATRVAIATFQADQGAKPTGELDEPTLNKLLEVHGC